MRRVAAVLIGAFLLAPAIAQDAKPTFPRWKPGEQTGTVRIGDQDESFVALVPRGYTARKKWPVVLLAHGNGGDARGFLQHLKPMAGKRPPLLVSLERCDNQQNAVGYVPKYLVELEKQFHIDPDQVYALGFSGGGFRLWDDIVCKKDVLPRFRGVVLVGSGKQSFDPPPAPEKAPTIVFVGDPRDQNYAKSRPAAAERLKELGFEVIVHEHSAGHSLPPREIKAVFAWIAKQIKTKKRARSAR